MAIFTALLGLVTGRLNLDKAAHSPLVQAHSSHRFAWVLAQTH